MRFGTSFNRWERLSDEYCQSDTNALGVVMAGHLAQAGSAPRELRAGAAAAVTLMDCAQAGSRRARRSVGLV
jgi:hypothetical protein